MAHKESKFASRLRKLGFEQLTAEELAYIKHRTERRLAQHGMAVPTLSRAERRRMQRVLCEPSFLIIAGENPSTQVTDETGMKWKATTIVDTAILTAMGFKNSAPWAPLALAMPPLPKEKTH